MQEKTAQRIGIAASIVGAVAGIAYLLSKGGGNTVVTAGAPYSPTPGDSGGIGAGSIGIPGPPGIPGQTGATGPAGLAAASRSMGNSGYPGGNSAALQSPSTETLYQYFVSGPSTIVAPSYVSNMPPSRDPSKAASGGGPPTSGNGSKAGCGCSGGGGGCAGSEASPCCGSCANSPASLVFPDGGGSCASTSITRLQRRMDKCKPGNLPDSAMNMIANTQYGPAPDLNLFFFSVRRSLDRLPLPVPDASGSDMPNVVPPSRFGAS